MHLYAVNFIPLLSSLYMFRAADTPIIRSTKLNFIYSHRYNHRFCVGCHGYLFPMMPGTESLQPTPHHYNPITIITTHSPSLQRSSYHYNPLPIITTHSLSLQPTPYHYNPLPIITTHSHHYNLLPIITTHSLSLQPTPYHYNPLPIITTHSPLLQPTPYH